MNNTKQVKTNKKEDTREIFSTFIDYSEDETNYIINYLLDNGTEKEDITEETIFQCKIEHIDFCYDNFKNEFEKYCNDKVLLLTGTIGLWHGEYSSGKLIDNIQDLWTLMSNYDDIKIIENSNGRVFINLYHHDGTYCMEIRQLTLKGENYFYNKLDGYVDYASLKDIEKLSYTSYTKNLNYCKNTWN